MKKTSAPPGETARPGPENVSHRWCPVCRQHVRVRAGGPGPGSGREGGGGEPAPGRPAGAPRTGPGAPPSFTPLCASCAVCMLKAAGARAPGRPPGGGPGSA